MWKSFFLASGFFLLILGVQTLTVSRFIMSSGNKVPRIVASMTEDISTPAWNNPAESSLNGTPARRREIRTREWMPWSLLAAGAITVMYTLSLPQRSNGPH